MTNEYDLKGPPIQKDAASWLPPKFNLAVPTLAEIKSVGDPLADRFPFGKDLKGDLDELHELAKLRDDEAAVVGVFSGRKRLGVSKLLNLRPQPLGASYNRLRAADSAVIRTGRELAQWFEKETPGLANMHALNLLFANVPGYSPPRQAQIWATLNVAIYASLLAAWHYKWDDPATRNKPRPVEIDSTISELYAFGAISDGSGYCIPVRNPDGFPGTPRHPAYPSGHSTVGGAGSEVLTHYFPELKDELDKLADNAGLARMWAGIHFRADHEFGMALGRAVARLVLKTIT